MPRGSGYWKCIRTTPITEIERNALEAGVPAFELLVRAGLASSNSDARKLIRGGGARVNDKVVDNETRAVALADVTGDGVIKLSAGRKRHALVRPV